MRLFRVFNFCGNKIFLYSSIYIILSLFCVNPLFAKNYNGLRKFFSSLQFDISGGYNLGFYQKSIVCNDQISIVHNSEGYYIVRRNVSPGDTTQLGLKVNWFTDINVPNMNIQTSEISSKDILDIEKNLNKDNSNATVIMKADFSGICHSFPFNLSVSRDFLKKFRFYVGSSVSAHIITKLSHVNDDVEFSFIPDSILSYSIKPFIILGYKFFENSVYTYLFEAQYGLSFVYSSLKNLNLIESFFPPDSFGEFGLAVRIEKHISNNFRFFWRLLYVFADKIDAPAQFATIFTSKIHTFGFQFGFSINYPKYAMCKVESCEIRSNHNHLGKTYRGLPLFYGKDSFDKRVFKK